ncbi:hypothetical protein FACS1894182_03380 [Bacteroidia bacterium]|nr:hypothetical protein FACS1894182_03380 [Bacteroidia bacterium]
MEEIFEGICEIENLIEQINENLEANPIDWKNAETSLDFIIAECERMKDSFNEKGGNDGR